MSTSRKVTVRFCCIGVTVLMNVSGNILMLSEGGRGAKNVYSLREGMIARHSKAKEVAYLLTQEF